MHTVKEAGSELVGAVERAGMRSELLQGRRVTHAHTQTVTKEGLACWAGPAQPSTMQRSVLFQGQPVAGRPAADST